MPTFSSFIYTQFLFRPFIPTTSFSSKTIIITGANGGLGAETATHLVRLGAHTVILACRSLTSGQATKSSIETSLKCSPAILEVWPLDLESPISIKSFVERAKALPRLDVVINNAGIHTFEFGVVHGTERTLAVNVIGTFLLAVQLLPKLRETAKKLDTTVYMTTVTSALYDSAKWPDTKGMDVFEWYKERKHFECMNMYNVSKLMQIYVLLKLSEVVDEKGVVINSLDPCFCKTGLGKGNMSFGMKVLMKGFQAATAKTAEEGSRLVVQTGSAGVGTHGKYMRAGRVQEYNSVVLERMGDRGEELWKSLLLRLDGLQEGVTQGLEK
jgi:NAD(P)-dependent dehydrogenase (short-subunit alcohol dehydrogenase family)